MTRRSGIAVVAVLAIAVAVGAVALRRHASTGEFALLDPASGHLAINAYPWANVTSIRNLATGAAVELDGPLVTPATAVNLAPGRYEVTLANPHFEERIDRIVEVPAKGDALLNVEFSPAARANQPMIGDLDARERALSSTIVSSPSGDAYLLRGCTRYTRAMLSGTPDAGLAAAREDFRAALKLDGGLHLDTELFSPKLIAFFEEVRRGG